MVAQRLKMNNANKAETMNGKIKPFSMKKINIIYVTILALITLLCLGLLIYPAAAKTQQMRLRLCRTEAELNGKLKLEDTLEQLLKRYHHDLRLAEGFVFTDRDIATFLENFSDFAHQANITPISIVTKNIRAVPVSSESEKILKQMSKDKKEDKSKKDMAEKLPGLLTKPMEIKIKGEYPHLINFLTSLEEYKQLLTINNLNIRVAREGYPALEASFVIHLYTIELSETKQLLETNENEEI